LDGHGTQVNPVYHELPAIEAEKMRPETELDRSNIRFV
jgi:hypothetical protein